MQNKLTNVRTLVQFSQYGEVKKIEFVGNKLLAMNSIRSAFGVKSFSMLHEYTVDTYLMQGSYCYAN